uniref:Uncharacterized protein n=1 Tax=Leptospira santarosai serovar Arenal str. MAVJ 401 TaxID=1049976 RepID=M6K235_9LEPT|nr:hypothetical protein LEP1GSC063_3250 [Leptospira santarosai serovar Arenal str. MAVJ 401]
MEQKHFWEQTITVPEELKRPFVDWLSFTVEYTDEVGLGLNRYLAN